MLDRAADRLVLEQDVKPPGRWDVARSDDADARAARWEKEAHDLAAQVAFLQEELALDAARRGLLHRFDASGRMALGALSYINVDVRDRQLLVQAFHTFPDDYAIVKSQSLFEIP